MSNEKRKDSPDIRAEKGEQKCEHVPFKITCAQEFGGMGEVLLFGFKPICGRCGVKLVAIWTEYDAALTPNDRREIDEILSGE